MGNKSRKESAVELSASLHADTMRVDEPAHTEVRLTGEGGITTQREGLPPGGTRQGETYRDVRVGVKIHADPESPPALPQPQAPPEPRRHRLFLGRRRKARS
jgi:hypothetical protein